MSSTSTAYVCRRSLRFFTMTRTNFIRVTITVRYAPPGLCKCEACARVSTKGGEE